MKNKDVYYFMGCKSIYNGLKNLYIEIGPKDSIDCYLRKEQASLKNIPLKEAYREIGEYHIGLAEHYLQNKKFDSAIHYFQKSLLILKNRSFYEVYALIGLGEVYSKQNMNSQAIKYYLLAEEKSDKYHYSHNKREIYEALENCYINEGNIEKVNKYSDLLEKIEDIVQLQVNKNHKFIANELIKEENSVMKNENKKKVLNLYSVLLLSLYFCFQWEFLFLGRNKR